MAIVARPYAVLGTTAGELAVCVARLGPRRGGRCFTAYTDWTVTWRYAADRLVVSEPFRCANVEVDVDGTVSLPQWLPLRSVPRALVDRWERLLAALREHEAGHVALAERAAADVRLAIAALPPANDLIELHQAVEAAALHAVSCARRDELAYDEATRDGAAQGATLDALWI